MTDTSPEIEEMIRARIMALSGAERFAIAGRMCDAARRMVLASFPAGLTEQERRERLYERYHGVPLPRHPSVAGPNPTQ